MKILKSSFNSLSEISAVNIIVKPTKNKSGIAWTYSNLSINKLVKMITGNKGHSYNICMWNCRRGLLTKENKASEKITDVKLLLQEHDLHLLCLVEADLHGIASRVRRSQPLTQAEIHHQLRIDNYSIILPQTWQRHGQARILLYVKEGVHVKVKNLSRRDTDLPSLSCEIGLGKERKTSVNFFYREWTSGVSGLADTNSQAERLARQIMHWKGLNSKKRDTVIMGDANLCALKWGEDTYQHKDLADLVQDYLLETSSFQLVTETTRSGAVAGGEVSMACLDHCYSDDPEKISEVKVVAAGNSDHLAVIIKELARYPVANLKL